MRRREKALLSVHQVRKIERVRNYHVLTQMLVDLRIQWRLVHPSTFQAGINGKRLRSRAPRLQRCGVLLQRESRVLELDRPAVVRLLLL